MHVLVTGMAMLLVVLSGSLAQAETKAEKDTAIQKAMVYMAETYNKQLPMMIDSETRMDSAIGGPGRQITYNTP